MGSGKFKSQHHPINTCPTVCCLWAKKPERGPTPPRSLPMETVSSFFPWNCCQRFRRQWPHFQLRRKGTGGCLSFLSSLKGMPARQPAKASAQTLRVTLGIWALLVRVRCRVMGGGATRYQRDSRWNTSIRKQGQEDTPLQSSMGPGRDVGFQKYTLEPHPWVSGSFERMPPGRSFHASLSSREKFKLAGASHTVLLSSWKNRNSNE